MRSLTMISTSHQRSVYSNFLKCEMIRLQQFCDKKQQDYAYRNQPSPIIQKVSNLLNHIICISDHQMQKYSSTCHCSHLFDFSFIVFTPSIRVKQLILVFLKLSQLVSFFQLRISRMPRRTCISLKSSGSVFNSKMKN